MGKISICPLNTPQIQMVHKQKKNCLLTLVVKRKMQIKDTVRCHHILYQFGKKPKSGNTKCGRGCGVGEILIHCW